MDRPNVVGAIHTAGGFSKTEGIDAAEVDDVIMGCANQAGEDNRNVARMALLMAGYPVTVPGETVNRLCASGLSAAMSASRVIMTGDADLMRKDSSYFYIFVIYF